MESLSDGWLTGAERFPSDNCYKTPDREISLLVVHCISLPPGEFGGPYIDQLFQNRLNPKDHPYFAEISHLKVSSHLLIERSGLVKQYVPFHKCAHHAGESSFQGRTNCNMFSIGIELEGTDTGSFTDAQYKRLIVVTGLLMQRWPAITLDRIVGHSDIAPVRKTDPGTGFDWERYRAGLSGGSETV